MKNNKNLVWALVALLILIVIGGYLYSADPLGWQGTSDVAQQESAAVKSESAGTGNTDAASSKETGDAKSGDTKSTVTGGESSGGGVASKQAAVELSTPTFDVVRVEPDGSTLIAGQAAPGTAVEVVANGKVIAMVEAGSSGDFAAVVDNRLAPGDHEIVLRSTGEGAAIAQSEEIATISVPESDPTELLVMVTKPGEASRILTKPEAAETKVAAKATTEAQTTAAVTADEAEPKEVAAQKAEETAMAEKPAAGKSDEVETAAVTKTEPAAAASEKTAGQEAETKVAMADQSSGTAASENAEASQAPAAESKTEMAKATPDRAKSDEGTAKSPAVVAIEPTLRIDAVEIENGRMFIAGSATPGGAVRVYADDDAIGSSNVSESGRFLVEAQKDIAVGDHTISAELVMQDGAAPVMRVAVPFTRPAGEMVAAVASPSADAENSAESGSETTKKPAATEEKPVETASAQSQVPAAEKSSQMTAAGSGNAGGTAIEQGSTDDAAQAATASSVSQNQVASADTQTSGTKTVVQAALEPRDGSVIIRRGDTLWQISRRIYGRGVRYTTIYLANEDQINNPDLIEPGQVFAVPEEPLANAEELHRKRIRSR
ncbi:LysM peptidoglycan-binding domain-containing protein [Hoeflea sp. TYP-13]|uniref:LysM peptidoglycan-binding domain-containing protein n=1 Tax=Hoeflea sp. TYP-13 TaxID=3230023 RepID=UPI0034C5D514